MSFIKCKVVGRWWHISPGFSDIEVVPKNPARFNPPGLVAYLSGVAQGTEVFRMAEVGVASSFAHGICYVLFGAKTSPNLIRDHS